jgi:hypothetical protein
MIHSGQKLFKCTWIIRGFQSTLLGIHVQHLIKSQTCTHPQQVTLVAVWELNLYTKSE